MVFGEREKSRNELALASMLPSFDQPLRLANKVEKDARYSIKTGHNYLANATRFKAIYRDVWRG